MSKETHIHLEKEPLTIMVCPQCVESGLQIDPRETNSNYHFVISTCRTHRICNGEDNQKIGQKSPEAKK